MPIIDAETLNPQAHIRSQFRDATPLNTERLQPPLAVSTGGLFGRFSITEGGLWTSTYDSKHPGGAPTSWARYMQRRGRTSRWMRVFKLDVESGIHVLEISSMGDATGLLGKFGVDCTNPPNEMFEELTSEGLAGIHLTDKAAIEARNMERSWFSKWDVESTLWSQWAFKNCTDLGIWDNSLNQFVEEAYINVELGRLAATRDNHPRDRYGFPTPF